MPMLMVCEPLIHFRSSLSVNLFWTYWNGLMNEAPSGERPIGMAT